MDRDPLKSIILAHWQVAFIERYVAAPKAKSLLVAASGTGKTITAIHAAARLIKSRGADSVWVITDVEALRDQWIYTAKSQGIELSASVDMDFKGDGFATTIQHLKASTGQGQLEEIGRARRWLIIVDDPFHDQALISVLVDQLLAQNKSNKALFVARDMPEKLLVEDIFKFDTETILDRSVLELPKTQARVARFAPSFTLLARLQRNFDSIDDMSWREFEKLIALLLAEDGYEVELMQGTRDGGVDVVAVKDMGPSGYFKALWQAKKKGGTNKVGIELVRELADTRQEFGASKGIIVTSSYLTRGALQRVERDRYILGKVDRDDLETWIRQTLWGRRER